jgi:hypothetical protein
VTAASVSGSSEPGNLDDGLEHFEDPMTLHHHHASRALTHARDGFQYPTTRQKLLDHV